MSQKKTLDDLDPEEKKMLLYAMTELRARGVELPYNLLGSPKIKRDFTPGSNGYYPKRNGKLFIPNPQQEAFVKSDAIFAGFFGSRGAGKSAVGAQKAILKLARGQSGSVLNPDFENFRYSTWPEFREWIPWNMVVTTHRYRVNPEWEPREPFILSFTNGAKVYCKGLKDPDSARGPNINWVWYDEAGRDKTGMGWKLAVASVRVGEFPQAWVTTTPKGTDHWTYKLFVKKEIPPEALEAFNKLTNTRNHLRTFVESFISTIEDNKDNLDPLFMAQLLANYPSGWLRDQELFAKFVDEGGTLGDRSWFIGKIMDSTLTDPILSVRYWDLAASEKKIAKRKSDDPDSTVGTRLTTDGFRYVIEDQKSAQIVWGDIIKLIVTTAQMDGPKVKIRIEQEGGSGGKNQVAAIMALPELAGYDVDGHRPNELGDKIMRANAWFSKAAAGMVYMTYGEWNESFLGQLSSFPGGFHDDKVDSVSGAFATIAPTQKKWSEVEFLAVRA